jgi:hypothetical protein
MGTPRPSILYADRPSARRLRGPGLADRLLFRTP